MLYQAKYFGGQELRRRNTCEITSPELEPAMEKEDARPEPCQPRVFWRFAPILDYL
jgi:hypothetical protein